MKKFEKPIMVTRPLFPELSRYTDVLGEVWESQWLSNGGKQHQLLESELKSYLGAKNISLFNNGTTALMTAIQSLRLQGEVITTPFTFPATTHVLAWNNITPVFCDIHPETLTIDPEKIEKLITAKTSAILGVHVYGIPCHVEEIQTIADRHGLRVVYDAAHAFNLKYRGTPIGEFGDISMFSFHPTKLFHTGEGGALVYNDGHLKERIEYLKNFGIKNEEEVLLPGINGKMGELQAAMGRQVLPLVDGEKLRRGAIRNLYADLLSERAGISLISTSDDVEPSEQYLCIRVDEELYGRSRNDLYSHLREANVYSRKYFFPLVSDYPCYSALPSAHENNLPVSKRAAEQVLCLPFHGALSESVVRDICDLIMSFR